MCKCDEAKMEKPCVHCGSWRPHFMPGAYCVSVLKQERDDALKVAERDGVQAIRQYERAQGAEAANARLRADLILIRAAILDLLDYRDHNTVNFQLEKADDYLRKLREVLDEAKSS